METNTINSKSKNIEEYNKSITVSSSVNTHFMNYKVNPLPNYAALSAVINAL